MTNRDLEYFRNLLETKRTSIVKDLGTLQSHSMQITSAESSGDLTYSDHMPDLGNSTMEREKAFLFAARDGAYLDQIEAALARIKKREFSTCRACGTPIPRERLEAVPTTEVCVPCKEKQNKSA
ncbi:MAG: TraR/DksA family transcriptional regulator [Gemmatimonadetes bacterium]|nr:TraR/DksA family transcriptional regulator [Gemmatimonadota bacterium]